MPETLMLSLIAELVQAALLDRAKEFVKDWLTDAVRIKRAIQKAALMFSTKLPGTEDALFVWVRADAFSSAMEQLVAGTLPESVTTVDEFLDVTGLGFHSIPRETVRNMLAAFYGIIREDLLSSRQGLVLVDNRVGEALRQLHDFRSDLAAQARPITVQMGIEGISTEFLNEMAHKQGWGGGFRYGAELHVNLELPPAVQKIAIRAATVHAVCNRLRTTAWYAIYGGSGSGKTQLAILVAHAIAGRKVWIRLGGPPSAACLIVELALTKLVARLPGQLTQQWCEAACVLLGSGGVIILDDLPRTTGGEALDEHLTALCIACANTGVRLITTSYAPLASGTRSAAGNHIYEESVPNFCNDDIRQLFQVYGASERFLASAWFAFVYRTTRRHPVLLVEAARYLQARGWVTDDRSFDDLLQGTFASALDLPTVERIRQTVPDETTREFLYRLKVIGWRFGVEEVQQISAVPPPLMFPLEHLAAVTGLWVHQDSNREYVLSPLLSRLGDENLPKELQQAIHLALARGILEKRKLGPLEASQSVSHFVAGNDVNSAALVLLVAWQGMLAVSELRDPFALTGIWADTSLPTEIALDKRIYLRALQVILRQRLGRDYRYEVADLELLLKEGESHESCHLVITVVGAMIATRIGGKDPDRVVRLVRGSIKACRRIESPTVLDAELDVRTGLLMLLWTIVVWIHSDEQYQQWFDAIRDLTPDEVRTWTTLKFASQASEFICGGLWMRMADLPLPDRNWPSVLERLEQLKMWARSVGVPSLITSALRSEIIVVAEHQQELPKAQAMAEAGMDEFHDLPQSKFLIADTIARQFYYFGDPADAIRWFDTAFAFQDAVGAATRVASLTIAGVAAQRLNVDLARRYLEEGVVAAASESVGTPARVRIGGELGILLWNSGQHREAYAAWNLAVKKLLDAREDSTEWKTLFSLFGNCTGYFVLAARGSGVYNGEITSPFPGILLREIADIDRLYNSAHDWVLPVQMAIFAESVCAYDDAVDWAARTKVGSGVLGTGPQTLLAGALTAGRLAEHRCAAIISAADFGDLDEAHDTEDFAQLDDNGRAQQAARYAARLNLIALAIELARFALQDRASAKVLARMAAELSRECAVRRGGSRLWSGLAEVFDDLHNSTLSWRVLWEKAEEARRDRNSALQVAYGVAAIAVAEPRAAVQIQLTIVPWLERMFSPTLYHATVAKFVPEYWQWALDEYPMNFGVLNRTRLTITQAQGLEAKPRVHAVLHAAAFSLRVELPHDVRCWLGESGQ